MTKEILSEIKIIAPSTGWRSDEALARRYDKTPVPDAMYARDVPREQFNHFHAGIMDDDQLWTHFVDTIVQANILYTFRGWGCDHDDSLLEPPQSSFFKNAPFTYRNKRLNLQKFNQVVFNESGKNPYYLHASLCKVLEANLKKSTKLREAALFFLRKRIEDEKGQLLYDEETFRKTRMWEYLLQIALQRFVLFLLGESEGGSIEGTCQKIQEMGPSFVEQGEIVPAMEDMQTFLSSTDHTISTLQSRLDYIESYLASNF